MTPILSELNITDTANLNLMKEDQSLSDLSAGVLRGMKGILQHNKTDLLIVQGDTTSAAMSALACFYEDVRVAHVEAGLRTYSRRNPFPEEMNRRLIASLADIHFPPTISAKENLLKEGIEAESIHMIGNIVVDAPFHARDHLVGELTPDPDIKKTLARGCKILLATSHRRESFGADLASICEGICRIANTFADQVEISYPLHLNPNVQSGVIPILSSVPNDLSNYSHI